MAEQTETSHLLLIVVGAHLRAEAGDRPLAYRLQERMQAWLEKFGNALNVPLVPVVCSDIWYVNQQPLQTRPTISLGGPGVNALSAYYAQRLGPAIINREQMTIQLDPEFVDLRVCIWGMDHDHTVNALDLFVHDYLSDYLRAVVTQVEPADE